ncbi:MAG: hypothetical protein GC168_07985 [Candidatus Hydrogenedens sp.]|nr:hypothetical protein [Candidatus Hydrogenedens sp.]
MTGRGRTLGGVFGAWLLLCTAAAAQSYRVTHDSITPVVPGAKALPPGPPDVVTSSGLTWNLYYEDVANATGLGFDDPVTGAQCRLRLMDCVTYISSVLNETGELDLLVGETFHTPENPAPGSFLARGGTGFECSADFTNGWAYERIRTGVKASPGDEDIFIQFNFDFPYHSGAGNAPSGTYDLQTILLHEITHGIGMLGLTDRNGNSLLTPCDPGTTGFSVWDSLLIRGATGTHLFAGSPPAYQGEPSDTVSADLFLAGAQTGIGYDQGGIFPGVYAPGFFLVGSSATHFDTGEIAGGPVVMEHAISSGRTLRRYQPLEIGALRDIGYANAADPVMPGCDGLTGELDVCGECRGAGDTCFGCDGVPASGLVTDDCGECGGDGVACFAIQGRGGYYEVGQTFELTALGPAGVYTWLRDGTPLATGTDKQLTIPALTPADSGRYRVQVEYGAKASLVSNEIPITVVEAGGLPLGTFTTAALLLAMLGMGLHRLQMKRKDIVSRHW